MLLQIAPQAGSAKARSLDQELVIMANNRSKTRRRFIFRAVASLSLSAVVLVLLVCMRRDRLTISDNVRSLERPVAALQAQIDSLGQLPSTIPAVPDRLGLAYANDTVREYAREATGPVLIGNAATQPLILGDDGHAVLIYEAGKVRCEWWARSRFVNEWLAQSARIREWDLHRQAAPPQLP